MRERLIKVILDALPSCYSDVFAIQIADHLITHGVTIPVRCKDCIHFLPNKYTESGGYRNHFGYYDYAPRISENDFCSYGERKDSDESDLL